MQIIFATQNKRKLQEMKELLSDFDVLGAAEAGITEEIIEDGESFAENALKKARFVSTATNQWVIADDSGICIEILEGAPGVYSARWAGKGASDEKIVEYTLTKMRGAKNRKAFFESDLALISPGGQEWVFSGTINGEITLEPKGKLRPKLPYDVIFKPEGQDRTFAEMTYLEKNSMSHRGRAFKKLRIFLEKGKLS